MRHRRNNKVSTFTIDNDNNITAYASAEEVPQDEATGLMQFASEAALTKVAADWPLSRLVKIWNSIPGQTPVKKFQDRKNAVGRVWNAIQPLAGQTEAGTTQPEPVTPAHPPQQKPAEKVGRANRKNRPQQTPDAAADRRNKKAEVIGLLKRAKGATLAEIMQTTAWQKHTVRGFISLLGSQGGWNIQSTKNSAGDRTYKIIR
jgi:hypothetical protein